MSIISRYITREFVKYFGLILIMVLCIYTIIDFIEKIDDFIEARLSAGLIVQYFLFNLPFIISQIIPIATLLAVLITFGLMSKNNELIALRAGGISLMALMGPVLRFGFGAFAGVILIAEVITPITVARVNGIIAQQVEHKEVSHSHQNDIWLKAPQAIFHAEFYQPETQIANGVTLHRFDGQFQLIERIDARTAVFETNRWLLTHGILQTYDPGTGQFKVQPFERQTAQFGFLPEDLAQAVPNADEMSFIQLYRYIQKIEAEGYDAVRYQVDLQKKIAFPFVCIIMALVGAGLAGGGKIKEGLPISISYGIGIAFFYWIAFSFSVSLGYADKLPPFIAVWTINLIWLCIVGILLLNAE